MCGDRRRRVLLALLPKMILQPTFLFISLSSTTHYSCEKPPCAFAPLRLCVSFFILFLLLYSVQGQEPATDVATTPTVSPTPVYLDYTDYWQHGGYAQAIKMLGEQIEATTQIPPRWIADWAELKFLVGKYDEAIRDLELLTAQVPQPVYWVRLAEFYRLRGRNDDFDRALKQGQEYVERFAEYGLSNANRLARGRIREMKGEDPKIVLAEEYGPLMTDHPDFAPGFLAAGELAISKKDYQLAAEYFEKVKSFEPDSLRALTGLAECYSRSDDERLEATLLAIEAINPRYPDAKAIEVERWLEAAETDPAKKIIEEMLTINPTDSRFLAYRAAAHFLDGNEVAMRETQEIALADKIAESSIVWRIPGDVAARRYRFKEAAAFYRKALEVNPADLEAELQLGFDLLRMGEEEEGRKILERVYEKDKYDVQLYNMLTLLDTLAKYDSITHGPFVLRLPKDQSPILAEDALALLDEEIELYQKKYKVTLETPILIQIFDDHDDFMVRSVGLPGMIGYMGICFGRLVTMDSPTAREKGMMNWKAVLWHEFAHVVTLQKTKNRMPRWLSEGISVYEEEQKSSAWATRMEPDFAPMVNGEPIPGLTNLESYFTSPKTPGHLMYGYFLAGEFVKFYVQNFGFEALLKSLDDQGNGADCEASLAAAADKSLDEINVSFISYLEKRFQPYQYLIAKEEKKESGLADALNSLVQGQKEEEEKSKHSPYSEAMTAASKAFESRDWTTVEQELTKAREMFPDHVGNGSPLGGLAKLHKETKNREKLKQSLEEQLRLDPRAWAACLELGEIYAEEKNWSELKRIGERAMEIDPFDIVSRKRLDAALRALGERELAIANVRRLAILDPPHSRDHRADEIELLIELKRWDEAKAAALALLEGTPHFWRAQELLLRIIERDGEKQTVEAITR